MAGDVARLLAALMAVVILAGFVVASPAVSAPAWATVVTISPSHVETGEPVLFTLTVFNGVNQPLSVYWVGTAFCGQSVDFKEDDGSAVIIPGSGSYPFNRTIVIGLDDVIPDFPDGRCHIMVYVTGQTPSESRSTVDYRVSIGVTRIWPLHASIRMDPIAGPAPLDVWFEGVAEGGDLPFSYEWSFGDGATSTERTPQHTFRIGGTYAIQLVIRDSRGTRATANATIEVAAGLPPELPVLVLAGAVAGAVAVTFVAVWGIRRGPRRRVRSVRRRL